MGYGVYEDREHDRWSGYMVPAECDAPGCETKIDRGLAYKCQTHEKSAYDDDGNEIEDLPEGCGLFFCEEHRYDVEQHAGVKAKPDSAEWMRWMLTDDSWEEWRTENPERTDAMRELVAQIPPEEPDLDDVQIAGRLNFHGDIRSDMALRLYPTERHGLTIPVDATYDMAKDLTTITVARMHVEADRG